ncbi:THAP domain containing 9 [Mactra antiquata]
MCEFDAILDGLVNNRTTTTKPNIRTSHTSLKTGERGDHVGKKECVALDHTYVVPDGENAVKRKIQKLEEQNHELKKKLRNTTLREKRSKMTCKILINDLKQQNLVSSELETKLATFEEIPCDLFRKASHEYTQEQKDFAVTLHLYSPKAYSYLKRESGLALPDPRTLRRFSINTRKFCLLVCSGLMAHQHKKLLSTP